MSEKNITSFDVLIEIPKGSRNKYEYDFKLKKIRYDRMIFSSMMYPADYGFVPETLALDGDPLDVLVLVTEPTFPGCVMEVKPIGVFHMADEKGPDAKVFCVASHDPRYAAYQDIEDLPEHLLDEVGNFFEVYKLLEPNKDTTVKGWEGRDAATKEIQDALARYKH